MSYAIKSVRFHKNAIKSTSRTLSDVSESALSTFASENMLKYHHYAISLLENGLKHFNEEQPFNHYPVLKDKDGNIVSDTLLSKNSYGKTSDFWLLDDTMALKYGRKFIPSNQNSSVQKKLHLEESSVLKKVKPFLIGNCACVGAAMHFKTLLA